MMKKFLRKHFSNILFFGFIIFLFTPYGLPVRSTLIKGVSFITTRVFSLEIDEEKQVNLNNYNWVLRSSLGKDLNLESLKGKVILINYWATWCPPCIAEMPSFQKLYSDYRDQVIFLFVANDEPEKVEYFMKDKGFDFPVYFQVSPPPKELRSKSLPTTYVIDSEGKIVVKKIGAADWNSEKVRDLLSGMAQ